VQSLLPVGTEKKHLFERLKAHRIRLELAIFVNQQLAPKNFRA